MEKLRIKYITDKQTIDKESIEDFELMANRRKLRESQVNKIRKMILEGRHFDAPMIVNEINGKKRILDGQHRISAISQIIKNNPEFQIEVMIIKYNELIPEEEKEMFTRWNSGTRQSSEDFITMYLEDIPIFEMMQEFPVEVTIYKGKDGTAQFRAITQAYISAKERILANFSGPAEFVDKVKKLGKEDYLFIKKFTEEFIENTGGFYMKNWFTRTSGLYALFFLYVNGDIKPKLFWEKFKKIKNNKRIIEMVKAGGFVATRQVKNMLAEKMGMEFVDEKVLKKGPVIYTEEHENWLRKNYPKTTWTVEDLTNEFNEQFNMEISEGTMRALLVRYKIKKDPNWRGSPNIWRKDIIDFLRECSKTMTMYQAHAELQNKYEHIFSRMSMYYACKKAGIEFQKQGVQVKNIPKEQVDLIKKNKNKKEYEIESIIIEQLGIRPENGAIRAILRTIPGKNLLKINKKKQIKNDWEEDEMS